MSSRQPRLRAAFVFFRRLSHRSEPAQFSYGRHPASRHLLPAMSPVDANNPSSAERTTAY